MNFAKSVNFHFLYYDNVGAELSLKVFTLQNIRKLLKEQKKPLFFDAEIMRFTNHVFPQIFCSASK